MSDFERYTRFPVRLAKFAMTGNCTITVISNEMFIKSFLSGSMSLLFFPSRKPIMLNLKNIKNSNLAAWN